MKGWSTPASARGPRGSAEVSALLLAAGRSLRMGGRPKLLLPWGEGTVLEASLDNLLQVPLLEVVVVLGHEADQLLPLVEGRARIVLNPEYASGMASSIRRGLEAIAPEASGVLIALGDMPLIPPEVTRRLTEAFGSTGYGIVAPTFRGRRGHPVIFHRRYLGELRRLHGEEGGRKVIDAHPDDLFELETDCPGVLQDIDTPEDYRRFRP